MRTVRRPPQIAIIVEPAPLASSYDANATTCCRDFRTKIYRAPRWSTDPGPHASAPGAPASKPKDRCGLHYHEDIRCDTIRESGRGSAVLVLR